jgi:hypothetical protein
MKLGSTSGGDCVYFGLFILRRYLTDKSTVEQYIVVAAGAVAEAWSIPREDYDGLLEAHGVRLLLVCSSREEAEDIAKEWIDSSARVVERARERDFRLETVPQSRSALSAGLLRREFPPTHWVCDRIG